MRLGRGANTVPTELLWVEDYDDTKTAQQRQVGVSVISQPDLRWQRCGIKEQKKFTSAQAPHHYAIPVILA